MFFAYLWSVVEGIPISRIPKKLRNDTKLAQAFGFEPDELPDESTFRRAKTNRFRDLQQTVKLAAEGIRNIAAERGAPIGYEISKLKDVESAEHTEPSKRTIDRMLRRKGKEVLQEIKSVAIPSMYLPRPEDPIYDKEDLLTLEAVAAIKTMAANGASEKLGDEKNPNPDLHDPFYEDGPTGETLLSAIKEMSIDEITRTINFALQKTYTRAKPRLHNLDNFDTNVMLAIDITYVAYYGEREGLKWVQGTPRKNKDEKPYDWCFMFATATIVGQHSHYVVGVLPIGNVDYAGNDAYAGNKQQTYYTGDVVRRLLRIADEYVNIRVVYADREFYSADVVHALEERDLFYVIPARKDKRIKPICEKFDDKKKGFEDDSEDEVMYVDTEYSFYGSVKYKRANTRVETKLVVLAPDKDDKIHDKTSPRPFVTNLEVSDEISLDRRDTKGKIDRYSSRAAIETSYTSIKDCAAWTTSKEFEVRWFHFGFACIVYNLWLLVDFLTQERLQIIETQRSPRITLKRFLEWLEKELVTIL